MIEGYFDPAGRPYVRAYVVVPGRQTAPEATALLLDTGADNTFIQPAGASTQSISHCQIFHAPGLDATFG